MKCNRCGSENTIKSGFKPKIGGKVQRYECKDCFHTFIEGSIGRVLYKPQVSNPKFLMCEKKSEYQKQ